MEYLLYFIGYVLCGFLSIYLTGLAERFTSFRSEDEWALLLIGPFGLFFVPLVVCIWCMVSIVNKIDDISYENSLVQKVKKLGRGK